MSQPAVIPYTVTIIADQKNALSVIRNGNFNYALPSPLLIEEGDVITMQQCLIDTQKVDTGTVVIPALQSTSIVFSYYDYDYNKDYKVAIDDTPWPAPTWDFYAGYSNSTYYELLGAQVKGTSLPTNTLIHARLWFSWVDLSGVFHADDVANENAFHYSGVAFPQTPTDVINCGLSLLFQNYILYIDGTLRCTRIRFDKGDTPIPPCGFYNAPGNDITVIQAGVRGLLKQTVNFNLPPGRYDPNELAVLFTRQLAEGNCKTLIFAPQNPVLIFTDDPAYPSLIFRQVDNSTTPTSRIDFDNSLCYKYYDISNAKVPHWAVGAVLNSIEYGNEGQVFEWANAHTPMWDSSADGRKNMVIYNDASGYHEIRTATGLVFHDLQPAEFWQGIGLYDTVLTPLQKDVCGVEYYLPSEMKYTQEASPIGAFCPFYDRLVPNNPLPNNPYYVDTTDLPPDGLTGNPVRPNAAGSYFTIRMTGINGTTLDDTINNNILAVISAQWNAGDVVTGYGDSAIPYIHRGNPYQLSSLQIKIDDGTNVEPQLGTNNCVVLTIQKRNPPYATAPPVKIKPLIRKRNAVA